MDYRPHGDEVRRRSRRAQSGDPSPVTAHGVFRAIQASAQGAVGSGRRSRTARSPSRDAATSATILAKELHEAGAKLVVTDIDAERVQRVGRASSARKASSPTRSTRVQADIFAPCALGAHHQRRDDSAAQGRDRRRRREQPAARGAPRRRARADASILYAPDYVANAGGVINVYSELAGWTSRALASARRTRSTTRCCSVFEIAKAGQGPDLSSPPIGSPSSASQAVGSMVRTWPQWPNK